MTKAYLWVMVAVFAIDVAGKIHTLATGGWASPRSPTMIGWDAAANTLLLICAVVCLVSEK